MSSSIRPLSPPRPSSASVTTTTVSTSPSTSASRTTGGASSSVSPPSTGLGGAGPQQQQYLPHHQNFHPPAPNNHPNPNPTQQAHGVAAAAVAGASTSHPPSPQRRRQNSTTTTTTLPTSPTNPSHLPTESQQAQIAQARTALVASIGNALDTELQTRASLLHANSAAIEKQERDVARALRDLRKEDDKLMKVLNEGSRKVKELGDVQNWAERLERDFLVLEETMRLVDRGRHGAGRRRRSGSGGSEAGSESVSGSGSWSGSQSGSGSWPGSDRGSVVGDDDEQDGDGDVRMHMDGREENEPRVVNAGKRKQVATASDAMDIEPAQILLPSEDAPATATSNNGRVEAAEQSAQSTTAQPSPAAMSWFKRFIWRTPG